MTQPNDPIALDRAAIEHLKVRLFHLGHAPNCPARDGLETECWCRWKATDAALTRCRDAAGTTEMEKPETDVQFRARVAKAWDAVSRHAPWSGLGRRMQERVLAFARALRWEGR